MHAHEGRKIVKTGQLGSEDIVNGHKVGKLLEPKQQYRAAARGAWSPALLSPKKTSLAPLTASPKRAPWSRSRGRPGGLVPALLYPKETILAPPTSRSKRAGAAAEAGRGAWSPRCYSLRRPF